VTTLICQFNIDSRIFICPVQVPARYEENLAIYLEKLQEHDVIALYRTRGDVAVVNPLRGGADMASFPGVRALDMHVITPWLESVFRRLGMVRHTYVTTVCASSVEATKYEKTVHSAHQDLNATTALFSLLDYTDAQDLPKQVKEAERAGWEQSHAARSKP
jgi:hypothetical protein